MGNIRITKKALFENIEEVVKEISTTGGGVAGATMTPGTGETIATKYAFGKRGSKNTTSAPDRKSKAIDYRELWEQEITTVADITATRADDAAKRLMIPQGSKVQVIQKRLENEPTTALLKYNGQLVHVNAGPFINQYLYREADSIDEMDVNDRVLMALRAKKDKAQQQPAPSKVINKNQTQINNLRRQRAQLMRDMEQEAEPEGGPIADRYATELEKIDKQLAKLRGLPESMEELQESYSKFKTETKTRGKSDQFHQAIKMVQKKVVEIGKLYQWVARLKADLSQGEDELKFKANTEKALQKIKDMVAELNQNIKSFK